MIFDVTLWRVLGHFHGHDDRVTCVCFSPNNIIIVSGSLDHTVRIWDLRTCTNTLILYGHSSPIYHVSVTLDGLRIISKDMNNVEIIWDIEKGVMLSSSSISSPTTSSSSSDTVNHQTNVQLASLMRRIKYYSRYTSASTAADANGCQNDSKMKVKKVMKLKKETKEAKMNTLVIEKKKKKKKKRKKKSKTKKICRVYSTGEQCEYGNECRFNHTMEE